MGYFELWNRDPRFAAVDLLMNLLITMVLYGAFPCASARWGKAQTPAKPYLARCFLANLAVLLVICRRVRYSGIAYLLWTAVFAVWGVRTLRRRERLPNEPEEDEDPEDADDVAAAEEGSADEADEADAAPAEAAPEKRMPLKVQCGILLGMVIVLLGCNLLQGVKNRALTKELQAGREQVAELQQQVERLELQKDHLKDTVRELDAMEDTSQLLYHTLDRYGYGSDHDDYYPEAEFLIVEVGETVYLQITCSIADETTVSFECDSDSCKAEWEGLWYNDTTNLVLTGVHAGLTTCTFTNSQNDHSFKILVVTLPRQAK